MAFKIFFYSDVPRTSRSRCHSQSKGLCPKVPTKFSDNIDVDPMTSYNALWYFLNNTRWNSNIGGFCYNRAPVLYTIATVTMLQSLSFVFSTKEPAYALWELIGIMGSKDITTQRHLHWLLRLQVENFKLVYLLEILKWLRSTLQALRIFTHKPFSDRVLIRENCHKFRVVCTDSL